MVVLLLVKLRKEVKVVFLVVFFCGKGVIFGYFKVNSETKVSFCYCVCKELLLGISLIREELPLWFHWTDFTRGEFKDRRASKWCPYFDDEDDGDHGDVAVDDVDGDHDDHEKGMVKISTVSVFFRFELVVADRSCFNACVCWFQN